LITYGEVVEVAAGVSFDGERREEQRDLITRRRYDVHLTVDVSRVIARPARTHNATARRRQRLVARYNHKLLSINYC